MSEAEVRLTLPEGERTIPCDTEADARAVAQIWRARHAEATVEVWALRLPLLEMTLVGAPD